jgi:hypothetical protein
MNTELNRTIELLEAYNVDKVTSPILSGHEFSFYVTKMANGTDVIYLTNDVDLGGVFEEEKPNCTFYSSYSSDNIGKPRFPIQVIEF